MLLVGVYNKLAKQHTSTSRCSIHEVSVRPEESFHKVCFLYVLPKDALEHIQRRIIQVFTLNNSDLKVLPLLSQYLVLFW